METSLPTSSNDNDVEMTDLSLLEQTQKLIHAEKRLTRVLHEAEPWLPTAVAHPHRRRVRPIPSTVDQVEAVLALARKYAALTSAPAGWNPNAPVVGFATPSPLPNQLRAGCLAALQLERAQAENKRKREQQQQQAAAQQQVAKQQEEEEQAAAAAAKPASGATSTRSSTDEPDPKRREVHRQDKQAQRPTTRIAPTAKKPDQQEDWNIDSSDDDSDEDSD